MPGGVAAHGYACAHLLGVSAPYSASLFPANHHALCFPLRAFRSNQNDLATMKRLLLFKHGRVPDAIVAHAGMHEVSAHPLPRKVLRCCIMLSMLVVHQVHGRVLQCSVSPGHICSVTQVDQYNTAKHGTAYNNAMWWTKPQW